MTIQPYLYFSGRADEAIAFYQKALGAAPQMRLRFKDSPEPRPAGMIAKDWEDKIMHASLKVGGSVLLLSDGCGLEPAAQFKGFALTFVAGDADEADRVFTALAEAGQTRMPLGKTFFSPRFGMVEDRFGVLWNVIVPA